MAQKQGKAYRTVKKLEEAEGGNFGSYSEDTGGGTPFEAGNSTTRTTKENGKIRQANNDTMQPRTEDGKFTYNSANGKGLKYPSRGKTVNPILTGGKNGVMIDEVEKQFSEKSGGYWDKYKGKWYKKGGEIIGVDLKTKYSGESIWNNAKKYNPKLGEFMGEGEFFHGKQGKSSKDEEAAKQKAAESGKEEYVISAEDQGIKVKPGMEEKPEHKPEPEPKKAQEEPESPKAPLPEQKQPEEEKQEGYSAADISKAKEKIKAELGDEFDESDWDDETIKEYIDSVGGMDAFGEDDAEESEIEKKIKAMGFDGNE